MSLYSYKYNYHYNTIHICIVVIIHILNMPIIVFGNTSNTSLFVQKPYLITNYIKSKIEEDIDLKNQYRIKNLPDPVSIKEAASKNYVDNFFNDPSIIRNDTHVNFNDKKLDDVRFVKVNSLPAVREHLTPKFYVDEAITYYVDKSSLLRLDPDEILYLDEQDCIIPNSNLTSPKTKIELPTKSYVDSLHESSRTRRDLSSVLNDQDNEIDNFKLTSLDSITVNRDLYLDNELADKKFLDDSVGEDTLLRFNQTLTNYLNVSVGNSVYNLTKYDKMQITDTTEIKFPNIGSDLLRKWNVKCNNKINQSKITDFLKSTKTNSPTGHSGATSLPPIGNAFMYIETSGNNSGNDKIFVSWEMTDIIQKTNITFYYNRYSILTHPHLKNMGCFKIQLLLEDNTWSTRYI